MSDLFESPGYIMLLALAGLGILVLLFCYLSCRNAIEENGDAGMDVEDPPRPLPPPPRPRPRPIHPAVHVDAHQEARAHRSRLIDAATAAGLVASVAVIQSLSH
jgi:hypothetical protein